MTTTELLPLILLGGGAFLLIGAAVHFTGVGSLNKIKSKTVGDGQHGTARWATKQEIQKTYRHIPFRPDRWRQGEDLPTAQGLVLGCVGGRGLRKPGKLADKVRVLWKGKEALLREKPRQKRTAKPLRAIVDTADIHCLMIGASGVGKTAFFLYPNLEYACASGMSYLALDTKGDLARNYGTIAAQCYGYQVAVIDLRNPTRSDGYNLLTLINHYMDVCREDEKTLAARAKAEKYAKILAKTIVNPEGDASNYGQTGRTSHKINIFMTRRRACLPLSSFCWRSTCRQRKRTRGNDGTSSACSSWCRICWPPARPRGKQAFIFSWINCRTPIRHGGLPARP